MTVLAGAQAVYTDLRIEEEKARQAYYDADDAVQAAMEARNAAKAALDNAQSLVARMASLLDDIDTKERQG